MTLRHDARVCRADAKSERIRLELGILTPEERQRLAEKKAEAAAKIAKEAAKGNPLGLEEE